MILVTGGARSGKSRYAETLCKDMEGRVCYIATALAIDKDMENRIKKHRVQRPGEWATIERYRDFDSIIDDSAFIDSDIFLLDCITIMITNLMFDQEVDYDHCPMERVDEVEQEIHRQIQILLDTMDVHHKHLILVTNEVGAGLAPSYRLGSIFRDIAGRVNQMLAERADKVYCLISGLPLRLK